MSYKISGNIDFLKDGFIHGWAVTTQDISHSNDCNLWIDGQFISIFEAVLYREDLKAEAIRSGIAGFVQPIPLIFCDDKIHNVTLKIQGSDTVIYAKEIKITKHRNSVSLDENVVFDHVNAPYSKHQKVLFLAGFTNQRKLLAYQKHFVRAFQQAGFYVVYVLASDTPNTLTGVFESADRVIVRENIGYDFGSWATVYQLCQAEFLGAKEVIWANDSMIGPLGSLENLLEKITASKADLWAITDSQEITYHFQSYFWGIKKPINQFFPVIDAFFFYRHALPKNKAEAIEHYELEAFTFFKAQGLNIDILFPEYTLIFVTKEKFMIDLQKYYEKWQFLFRLPLMKEELHKLNSSTLNMATTLINHFPVNSSHFYWDALLDSGFPFIKRELLTLNPTNYPFPEKFRATFEKYDAINLLDDLAITIKFTRII
ncbi:MAG: hypothetical protein RLZZ66_633 [Pseudomonadota bacterium]